MKKTTILNLLAVIPALILLQTLYFKFSGHAESVMIFTMLGVEPWGRYTVGVMELVASTLLVIPRTRTIGALMTLGITAGAIVSHIIVLGIESNMDGGLLFGLAVVAFVSAAIIVYFLKDEVLKYWKLLLSMCAVQK
jgi:putative oxidoreductase